MQESFDKLHNQIIDEIMNADDNEIKDSLTKDLFQLIRSFNHIMTSLGKTPKHNLPR